MTIAESETRNSLHSSEYGSRQAEKFIYVKEEKSYKWKIYVKIYKYNLTEKISQPKM